MWYYTINEQSLGPVDDAGLDQLIARGVINANTFVWKEGLTEWKPLREVRVLSGTGARGEAAGISTCTMCGKNVGEDNLVDLLGRRVCAACKPMALQTLREGAPLATSETAWSDGKKVVTHDQKSLPPRCYKCNHAVTEPPLKRKLYWHPPAWYLLIFVHLFIYVIVAIIVRKKAAIEVYLCTHHIRRRKYFMLGGGGGAFLGLVLVAVGAVAGGTWRWLILGGIFLFVGAIIAGLQGGSILRATRIKDGTVWLSGASREFLASLPPWS